MTNALMIWVGWIMGGCALLYLTGCIFALFVWSKRCISTSDDTPPISLLKPLCGLEPGLYENLRSFCTQDYPVFQIIFGAESPDDPALAVAHQLQTEFSHLDIQLVSGHHIHCGNRKVANLMHMEKHIAFEYLAVSDSDIRVGSNYLCHLAYQLDDPGTGVVTCLYRGRSGASVWSRLGALHINEYFLPSVLAGRALGLSDFGFGATLALRRKALDAIGGFEVLADQIADDYMLAKRLRHHGLKTVLSACLVETMVNESSFSALWRHELRWARTIRTLQPVGHAFSCITYTLPATLLAALLANAQPWAWAMPASAIMLRFVMHRMSVHALGPFPLSIVLLPIRDMMAFVVWLGSYCSRHVHWRGRTFEIRRDGFMWETK